jgi:hypothetical protein
VAGDFQQLAPRNQRIGSPETKSNARKAAIFGPSSCFLGIVTERRNAWLTWEDSNCHIPDLQTPFEMSAEFQTFSRKFGLETFGTILPLLGSMETKSECVVWFGLAIRNAQRHLNVRYGQNGPSGTLHIVTMRAARLLVLWSRRALVRLVARAATPRVCAQRGTRKSLWRGAEALGVCPRARPTAHATVSAGA